MASTPSSESTSWTEPEGSCDKCGAPSSWAEEYVFFWTFHFSKDFIKRVADANIVLCLFALLFPRENVLPVFDFNLAQAMLTGWHHSWTRNLSRSDGNKVYLATYFASPRMWPLGYILGSPYSPLALEHDFPKFNWRDRFEDLLALESGSKMISVVSRQNEMATASRIRSETAHSDINYINQELQRSQDLVVLLQRLREISVRNKESNTVSKIDDSLPGQKMIQEELIGSGNDLIRHLKDLQDKPASRYKKKSHWVTSLVSSGAMSGWESALYHSADGWQADVYKADGSGDGSVFTDMDLATTFREGSRLEFRQPEWSTIEGALIERYPELEQLSPEGDPDPDVEHTYDTLNRLRPYISSQVTTAQPKKSWNGNIETRVVLKNRFTDGTEEEKTIVNDASKVLEEVEKFHASSKEWHRSVGLALWELSFRKHKDNIAIAKEMEDEGVE